MCIIERAMMVMKRVRNNLRQLIIPMLLLELLNGVGCPGTDSYHP